MKLFVLAGRFRMLILMSLLLALVVAAVPAFAQSSEPSGLPAYDPNAFFNIIGQILLVVLTAVGGYASSPITVFVVAFLKRVVPQSWKWLDAKALTALTSLALMGLLAAAVSLGYEAQFRQAVSIITAVIGVLAGSQQNLTQAARLYNEALAANAPFTGYQRSPNAATTQAVAVIQKVA